MLVASSTTTNPADPSPEPMSWSEPKSARVAKRSAWMGGTAHPGEGRLEAPSLARAARDLVEQLAEADPGLALVDARARDVAADGEQKRARRVARAEAAERRRAPRARCWGTWAKVSALFTTAGLWRGRGGSEPAFVGRVVCFAREWLAAVEDLEERLLFTEEVLLGPLHDREGQAVEEAGERHLGVGGAQPFELGQERRA